MVTKEFMQERGIDLVVHGFADPEDLNKQREFFQIAMDEGKFEEISYYSHLSTTDIIQRIRASEHCEEGGAKSKMNGINPKWFGSVLAAASGKASELPYNPFPLELRTAIEPQLRKATRKRQDALNAICEATGPSVYEKIIAEFKQKRYSEEGIFTFDTQAFELREKFLQSCGLPFDFDLSKLHECTKPNFKDDVLYEFAREYRQFQAVFDEFVQSVCCPFVASLGGDFDGEVYYQSFPCIRVVRPGDFSIGPHGDVAYGHHPCSINFYIPLTQIEGSASLFLESQPGSEDWHPIEANYGMIKHFAGGICAHWTPENHTDFTRVSLDFRIIPGSMFRELKCGGKQLGGVRDVYRERDGYYKKCCSKKEGPQSVWVADGPSHTPDARFGFPWTKVSKLTTGK